MPTMKTILTPFGPMNFEVQDDATNTTALADAVMTLTAKVDSMHSAIRDVQALLIKVLLK